MDAAVKEAEAQKKMRTDLRNALRDDMQDGVEGRGIPLRCQGARLARTSSRPWEAFRGDLT